MKIRIWLKGGSRQSVEHLLGSLKLQNNYPKQAVHPILESLAPVVQSGRFLSGVYNPVASYGHDVLSTETKCSSLRGYAALFTCADNTIFAGERNGTFVRKHSGCSGSESGTIVSAM